MQVNHANFPATLEPFLALLRTCDFYAFDEEMTGISVQDSRVIAEDITCTADDCYYAKREAAERYAMIQVGLCLFHREPPCAENSNGSSGSGSEEAVVHYTARPFNFWLFPHGRDDDNNAGETRARDVALNPSSLSFLRRHDMDFQTWVYSGVSYCDAAREQALRARLASEDEANGGVAAAAAGGEGAADGAAELPLPTTDAEVQWVEAVVRAAVALQRRVDGDDEGDDSSGSNSTATTTATSTAKPPVTRPDVLEEMQPPPPANMSRYAREYLAAQLRRRVPRVTASMRRQGSNAFSVLLTALSPSEHVRRAAAAALRRRRAEVDAVGFRLVYAALVQSQKPCVGHNCMADLLFLMSGLDAPLPPSLREWKARAQASFPCILDTRYVAGKRGLFAHNRFRTLHLGCLFDAYTLRSSRVHVTLPLGFQAYDPITLLAKGNNGHGDGGTAAHEAGYDALMTGTVLLNLLAELGHDLMGGDGVAACPRELRNKVALFRSLYALDLDRDDGDEYTTADVLDLRHAATVRANYLSACLAAASVPDAALYSVDAQRTLAVLPPHADAAALLQRLSTSPYCTATMYQPRPSLPQTLAAATGATSGAVMHAAARTLAHTLCK